MAVCFVSEMPEKQPNSPAAGKFGLLHLLKTSNVL